MPNIVTLTMNPTIDESTSIDNVVPERKLRCSQPVSEPGGGGINVSRAIHALGGESLAIYPAGGPPGQMLRTLLDQEEIDHHPVPIQGWTRKSLTVYETSTGQQYRFSTPGPPLREEEWVRCLDEVSGTDRPSFLVASGSIPPGVPPEFYGRLAEMARDVGARMILDTTGEPLRLALQEGVFLIKPNMREFADLVGAEIKEETQQIDLAQDIVRSGRSAVVVVSLGAAGALVVWDEGYERLRAPTVPIQSKVGAGDSMTAGMVLGLARGLSVLQAAWLGVVTGAAAVMTPGTELCRREDVERLLNVNGSILRHL